MRRILTRITRHPKITAAVTVVLIIIGIAGASACTGKNATTAGTSELSPSAPLTTASGRVTVTAVPADQEQLGSTNAAQLLATLPVKGRAPKTGYSRVQFGAAWTDANDDPLGRNGCDTRNDILRRDLTGVSLNTDSNGCTVLTGTLNDPYTATRISFLRGQTTSSAIQIDHVVALSDAWQKGAQQWTPGKRVDLANDPLNLLAVDGPSNGAKGDGDAATWLPPNRGYRCAYVARQIAVKARYGLWMTRAEHDAIAEVLATCPSKTAPTESGTASSARPSATQPATTTRPPTQSPS